MPSVTGYTAARMLEIENGTVVSGSVNGSGILILMRRDGTPIIAGSVVGPQGPNGPPGGIGEAPNDGNDYIRRNEAWHLAGITSAPEDGQNYHVRDGAYVLANRPWTLSFNQSTGSPPSGFSVDDIAPSTDWEVNMNGSGRIVNYNMRFCIMGSLINNDPKMIFPTSLRPVQQHQTIGLLADNRSGYLASGSGLVLLGTNGHLTAIRGQSAVMTLAAIGGSPTSFVGSYGTDLEVDVKIMGSYIRGSDALPDTASYV